MIPNKLYHNVLSFKFLNHLELDLSFLYVILFCIHKKESKINLISEIIKIFPKPSQLSIKHY